MDGFYLLNLLEVFKFGVISLRSPEGVRSSFFHNRLETEGQTVALFCKCEVTLNS